MPSPQVLLPRPAGARPISNWCFLLLAKTRLGHLSHLFLINLSRFQSCQAGTCWAGESNYCLSTRCKFCGALAKHTKRDLEKYNFSLLLLLFGRHSKGCTHCRRPDVLCSIFTSGRKSTTFPPPLDSTKLSDLEVLLGI